MTHLKINSNLLHLFVNVSYFFLAFYLDCMRDIFSIIIHNNID